MTASEAVPDHETIFARVRADASNTRIELPPVDVNQLLRQRYDLDQPLTFARTMLWDLEVRKAWRPHRRDPLAARVRGSLYSVRSGHRAGAVRPGIVTRMAWPHARP